ncbi:PAS domain-containing sensor histidine kinase [Desulfospira joergensenii]|uniref:PAS domain-containing sensor histidine kinase n=1 Tax=Desulfospira joergensenii TaxID=53329 RepID=UPI0003B2FCD5|nr:PAS domain S-box protein [Desulfospira joergensenii]
MKDEDKSKSQLIDELQEMRKRLAALTCSLEDVERKQTLATLGLAKVIFDKAPIGIWIMGKDGEVLDVNEQGCNSLGYTKEELCHMTVFDFAPGYTPEDWAAGTAILNKGGTRIVEALHQRKSGELISIQVIQNLMRFEGQEFRVAFVQDITERKQNESRLRESEQLLTNILESMNEGILVLDSEFRYTIFNKAMELITDTPRKKVLGQRPWDIFPFVKNSPIEENQRKVMKGEMVESVEVYSSLPHNPNLWTRDSFSPIRDTDGRIIGVVGVVSDITQRKQDEEELRRLRNYLSNIIHSMPSVLVGVDSEGIVTQWNRRAEQVTGICSEKALSQPIDKVFPNLAPEVDRIKTSIQECRVISVPKVSRKHEQEVRYEDITIYPLVANGVEGAVIRLDDVTDRVRIEEMMIQSEKMLSVGGLAAGMAHEINNPLAGMIQTANVMKSRLGGLDMPANLKIAEELGVSIEKIRAFMEKRSIFKMLDTINESGQRAAEIVENMLSFARKSNAVLSTHHPIQLMDRILELAATDYNMKKQYDFKTIKIVKKYEKDLPMISCEGAKIQQVLLNILRNGSQAMQTAKTKFPRFILRIFSKGEPEMVNIEIEDNGPGMDEQTRLKVFDPFFTTKPVGEGTGLGLSVSYFIITKNHKGTMDVISEPGKGTNFIIRLPVDREK